MGRDERRTQLLDLGVHLLATRSFDELSIDLVAEEAGVSRGLLYHYFASLAGFQEAVVRRAAEDLIARTAPPPHGDPLERLTVSVTAYVDYVDANHEGYLCLVKGALGGNEMLRGIYDQARSALTDRIFTTGTPLSVPDTPATRLCVRGWTALTEEMVLAWKADPAGVTRHELLEIVVAALPALVGAVPDRD